MKFEEVLPALREGKIIYIPNKDKNHKFSLCINDNEIILLSEYENFSTMRPKPHSAYFIFEELLSEDWQIEESNENN